MHGRRESVFATDASHTRPKTLHESHMEAAKVRKMVATLRSRLNGGCYPFDAAASDVG